MNTDQVVDMMTAVRDRLKEKAKACREISKNAGEDEQYWFGKASGYNRSWDCLNDQFEEVIGHRFPD